MPSGRLAHIPRFILCIGAMKCATTSFFRWMSQHPEVCPSRQKETEYFLKHARDASLDEYEANFPFDHATHRIALEASTNYTSVPDRPNAAECIVSLGLPVKFVYILRDPLLRLESDLNHGLDRGTLHYDPNSIEVPVRILNRSLYFKQATEYLERFPRENLLLLKFEELTTHPEDVLARVCRFAGIDDGFRFHDTDHAWNSHNDRKRRFSLAYRFLRTFPAFQSLVPLVPTSLKKRFRRRWEKMPKPYRRLTDAQRAYVLDHIRPDAQRLQSDLGFDISGWNLNI